MTQESHRCLRCGTRLSEATRYCPHCGARQAGQPEGLAGGIVRLLSAIGLAFAVVILGGLGACFAITGLSAFSEGFSGLRVAVTCWLVAAALFAGLIRAVR